MHVHPGESLDFQQVGPHRVRIELPDILHMRLNGDVHREHFVVFHGLIDKVPPPTRVYALRDARNGGVVTPETRRYVAKSVDVSRIAAIVTYGASFQSRTVLTMLSKAMRLLNPSAPEAAFFATEAEARTWIAAHRTRSSQTAR